MNSIQDAFSVEPLTKDFYEKIQHWYFWAIHNSTFPSEPTIQSVFAKIGSNDLGKLEAIKQEHKAQNVIRMLTRLLFVWFIKQKKLIPEELFDLNELQENILKEIKPEHIFGLKQENRESIYYKAILQNLFFATLNCPIKPNSIDKRKRGFSNGNFGVTYLMRYEKYFKDSEAFIQIVNETVPFLNGGLFECLDIRGEGETKDKRIYIDGFSDNLPKEHQLIVPDYLFFGIEEKTDLSSDYGIKNKKTKEASVMGLINILKEYNFTIDENEPNDIEVALDPKLLGKVFENLLASYNPETKTTARKQTGSFYTPREIVNYMVDESLIAHLKNSLQSNKSFQLLNLKKQESLAIQNSKQNLKQDALGTFLNSKQDASDTFLNPNDEIIIKKGKLPHWSQKNSWYFVTFRLADSIPKEKIELLKNEREIWLKKHSNKDKKGLTKEELKEYYSLFSQRVENWLNAGYGSCIFKDEKYAKIVGNALLYFNNKRYELDEWVVMPNHVHILFKPLNNYKIEDICHSWKSYTANKINKLLGRRGQLWMHESYDHIVRNEKAFMAIKKYIQENPRKANIVLNASSFSEKVSNASSFSEKISKTSGFSEKSNQIPKQDALDTLLHQLVSLSSVNPFEDNEELSKEILHSLNNCKILDPACGSGAFPMGILQKMVHILRKVDPENKYWQEIQMEKAIKETESAFKIKDKKEREQFLLEINEAFDQTVNSPDYARKLFLIENCIYGVDIQPIATQISKLRFFISLVVEQKVNKEKQNFGIRPLPNLETKFITANTLIGIEKPKLELDFFDSENIKKLEKELKFIRHKLFGAKTKKTKLKYRTRDKELREQIAEELQENGWGNEAAQQLAKWDPYDQNGVSPFFDPEWMFDIKDGFEIVIGNPPYIGEKGNKNTFLPLKVSNIGKRFYQGKMDIFYFFFHIALDLLKNNGINAYITTNYFITATGAKNLRKDFKDRSAILKMINFGEFKIFDSAAGQHNMITILKKGKKPEEQIHAAKVNRKGYLKNNLNIVSKVLNGNDEKTEYYIQTNKSIYYEKDNYIGLWPKEFTSILKKIVSTGKCLGNISKVKQGLRTGADSVTKMHIAHYGHNGELNKGIFVLEYKDLVNVNVNHNILKDWFKNSNICKYFTKLESNSKVIFSEKNQTETEFSNKYYDIYQHLLQFKKLLIAIRMRNNEKPETWFCLDRTRDSKMFIVPKIVAPQRSKSNTFGYNEIPWYASADVYFITQPDEDYNLKYILGVLNSKLIYKWLYYRGKRKGDMLELYQKPLSEIPIAKARKEQQSKIVEIVDQIIQKKENTPSLRATPLQEGNTTHLENKIDLMVYKLYKLTYEEVKIVDPEFWLSKEEYESFEEMK